MASLHNITSGDRLSDNVSQVWMMDEMGRKLMADLERSFRDSRYTYRDPLTAALIGVYVVVFLLSIVGNVLVVVIIRLDKSNRGVDAYLMLNLAVADLLGTSTTPISAYITSTHSRTLRCYHRCCSGCQSHFVHRRRVWVDDHS